jgi:hypothetical protein
VTAYRCPRECTRREGAGAKLRLAGPFGRPENEKIFEKRPQPWIGGRLGGLWRDLALMGTRGVGLQADPESILSHCGVFRPQGRAIAL